MAIFNLYFLQQQLGDCLSDSQDRDANCRMTQHNALILMLSLVMSAVLFGYKISHLPTLRDIWVEKLELNWKRDHMDRAGSSQAGKQFAMPDATEMACIEREYPTDARLRSTRACPVTPSSPHRPRDKSAENQNAHDNATVDQSVYGVC
jgi:hypothetical protein